MVGDRYKAFDLVHTFEALDFTNKALADSFTQMRSRVIDVSSEWRSFSNANGDGKEDRYRTMEGPVKV